MPSRRNTLSASLIGLVSLATSAELVWGESGYDPRAQMQQFSPNMPNEMMVGNGVSGPEYGPGPEYRDGAATANPMLWQQYQALQSGDYVAVNGGAVNGQTCSSCGSNGYDRCGCNTELFPWISGPGNCDQWCVGPKWGVEATGLFFFREDADFGRVVASEGGTVSSISQFEHGAGTRLFVTGYNDAGYGVQVGYEGIFDWNANMAFDSVGGLTREFNYQSHLNSLEINFLPNVPSVWKWFSGFRYLQIAEDFTSQPMRDPVATSSAAALLIDNGSNHLLDNKLFGFQLGSRRDAWNVWHRFTIETFANGGVYCNKFRRDDNTRNTTTVIVADDPLTPTVNEFSQTSSTSTQTSSRQRVNDIAFLGEAGVSGVWQLNSCLALRGGYQVLAVDGIGQGLDAFLSPNGGLDGTTLVYHGVQFGLEYRR